MDNFLKPFVTLFSIGVFVTLAKKLRQGSKAKFSEVVAECIIAGAVSTSAALLLVIYPTAPFVAVMGLAGALAALGVNFFSQHIEDAIERAKDHFLGKKGE